jgi:dual specificity MAP kinase phosphatase
MCAAAVLVHCGAGVSRSACMVMMYLMRSKMWSAQQARDHCIAARSLVCPNDGFWRVLCALEGPLGILNR